MKKINREKVGWGGKVEGKKGKNRKEMALCGTRTNRARNSYRFPPNQRGPKYAHISFPLLRDVFLTIYHFCSRGMPTLQRRLETSVEPTN